MKNSISTRPRQRMLNSCANRRSFFLTYLSNPNYNYRSLRRIPWYYRNKTDDALLHQSCPQTFRFQRARKLQRIVILKEPQCWVRFEVTKIKHSKVQCWAQVLSLGLFKFANFLRPNLCFQFHLNKILFEKKNWLHDNQIWTADKKLGQFYECMVGRQ